MLDIGCGEGADSVFYAKKGFQVTAIDNKKDFLNHFRAYKKHNGLSNISIHFADVTTYNYPKKFYDVISCLLVICCIKRSDFEKIIGPVKEAVKPGGYIVMSARNYLDPEFKDYSLTEKMIEPNTFIKKEDCCRISYFIEKDRFREVFNDFEILYYFEGLMPDKYKSVAEHGDSYIICKRKS